MWAALLDLVLPTDCAACGAAGTTLCRSCTASLHCGLIEARPRPVPAGLPRCVAAGPYEGGLREAILAYKERGRRGLAAPLGDLLGVTVRAGWPDPAVGPVVLIPVPGTAASIRARHGDHMLRLARRCARDLTGRGYAVAVARPLTARPKADSTHLDREQRAAAAQQAFAPRPGFAPRWAALRDIADTGAVVLLDDVLTTGATLAAVATRLAGYGVPVSYAAVLAATQLRSPSSRSASHSVVIRSGTAVSGWPVGDDEVARED